MDDALTPIGSKLPARLPASRRAILAGPAAMLFAGAARAQEKQPPKGQKGQIVVGFTQEPTVFNPLMPRIETDQGIWFALFNPLWRADPDGTFVAELAAEVPTLENGGISADGLTWTIKLRRGVKWHDGVEFTAEDVKYTLGLLNDPNFRAYTRQGHGLVRDITVRGPYELSWTMAKAYAPYLALLTWTFMVPKHALGRPRIRIPHRSTRRRSGRGRSSGTGASPARASLWWRIRITSATARMSSELYSTTSPTRTAPTRSSRRADRLSELFRPRCTVL